MHANAKFLESPHVNEAGALSTMADAELLRQYAATGAPELMGEVFTRHADSAYRIARCILRHSSDAEDAVQTAFLNVLRSRAELRNPEKEESVKAWLLKSVVNACRMRVREETARRRREAAVAGDRPAAADPNSASELGDRAVEAARGLAELYRLPVWMHYLEGLPFKDVAAALALPEATVRSQASRGIEQLRQALARPGGAMQHLTSASLIAVLASAPLDSAPVSLTAALIHTAAATGKTAGAATKVGGTLAKKGGLAFKTFSAALVTALVIGGIFAAPKLMKLAAPPTPAAGAKLIVGDNPPAETDGERDAQPSAAPEPLKITGWRGDWTGRYPDATPPLQWSVHPKNFVGELRCSTKKPAADASQKAVADQSSEAMPDGQIREWLVAGPFPFANPAKASEACLPSEAELQPADGDKAGDLSWKAVSGWTGDFAKLFGKNQNQAAYACSYVYSPTGGACITWLRHSHCMQMWVNGKVAYDNAQGFVYKLGGNSSAPVNFTLNTGWNRLLVKVTYANDERWEFSGHIFPARSFTYEESNVAWIQRMPNYSSSTPLVVGDKIYVMSEPSDLICCNKADGKVLWISSNNQFDTLTREEIDALPAIKEQIEPLCAKIKRLNDELVPALNTDAPQLPALLSQKNELEKQLVDQLKAIDAKRFHLNRQDGGFTAATPCSDGRNVFAWTLNGVCSCFDGDGKRKWSQRINELAYSEHGNASSPALVNGKLIVLMFDYTAFDAETGKVLWKQPLKRGFCASFGSIVPVPLGNDAALLSPVGSAVRASDGRLLWDFSNKFAGECPTSVVDNGVWYNFDKAGVFCVKLPENVNDDSSATILKYVKCGEYAISSPLFDNGLLYCVEYNGKLTVVDTAAGEVVYTQQLPLQSGGIWGNCAISSSPTLAGKHIYVFDVFGNAVVFEPGRAYKQVALNKVDILNFPRVGETEVRQERLTQSNPVFHKNRIYVRGDTQLVCIAAGTPTRTVTLPDVFAEPVK